jgi:drug/metabolite transporter (DMT)-like permease
VNTAVERRDHLDRLAIVLLVLSCAFWGFQQILIKTTVAEVPPLWQASIRFVGATGLLWLWCRWRQVPLFRRDGTLKAGLCAGLLFAGEFACIYIGLQYTTASRLTVFLYTSPFVVALLLPLWVPSERLRAVQWWGLCLAFASVLVAFGEGLLHASTTQRMGDAIALAAGTLWGLTTLVIRTSVLAQASAEKTLFYQVAVTAGVAPLLSWGLGETWGWSYSAWAWGSMALQTVVGAFASYLTWMWLLRRYPATQVSTFVFLTPVFALLFGVGWLGEPLTLALVLALCGVAAGMVLVSRRP